MASILSIDCSPHIINIEIPLTKDKRSALLQEKLNDLNYIRNIVSSNFLNIFSVKFSTMNDDTYATTEPTAADPPGYR